MKLDDFLSSLAQPRLVKGETQIKASGIDIVVAIDLSGSMASLDFEEGGQRVNRIDMARKVLTKFIDGRPNDRIGLVAFATEAFIAAPFDPGPRFFAGQPGPAAIWG